MVQKSFLNPISAGDYARRQSIGQKIVPLLTLRRRASSASWDDPPCFGFFGARKGLAALGMMVFFGFLASSSCFCGACSFFTCTTPEPLHEGCYSTEVEHPTVLLML